MFLFCLVISILRFYCIFHILTIIFKINLITLLLIFLKTLTTSTSILSKIKNTIPLWAEISNNMRLGRTLLANIWKDMGLVRTAVFIENEQASNANNIQLLLDRLNYLFKNSVSFPSNMAPKSNQETDWINAEDADLIKEIQESLLSNTTFVSFEGKFTPFDKFCSNLYEYINPTAVSQDFPPQSVGAGRYIVGFYIYPQIDIIAKNFPNYKVSVISSKKYKEITNKDWENTSGAIFFLNGKNPTYPEVQAVLSTWQPEFRNIIKRVHLKQDMGIIFVSSDKLIYLLENIQYITIGEEEFRLIHNMAPEFYNGIGKLILSNCPIDQITVVRNFLIRNYNFNNDDIVKMIQIKRSSKAKSIVKYASYMIWFRGEDAVRKALLTIMDLSADKKKVSSFHWPSKKGEDILPISIKFK